MVRSPARSGVRCIVYSARCIPQKVPSFRFLLLRHGYAFLFCYVFAVQAGIPIPADPLLLIMGALVGDHVYSFWPSMLVAMTGALAGDCFWYELGRVRGRSVLALLCKLSLEPDTCIQKTEGGFLKRGAWTLLFAKFIPGMSLVSMPLAGAIRMSRWRFLLTDAAGCALWCSAYLLAGRLFHKQVTELIGWLGFFGRRAGLTVLCLIAAYIAIRFLQRYRLRRELRINRVTAEEAFALMNGGTPVTVLDLRNPVDIEIDGLKIAGAVIIRPADLRSRSHEIPQGNEVILYCT
jgi:membrane protein DedA with SNARE-associated domain